MKFTTVMVALASACLSTATPVEKRQLGGVLICTGPNATGECTHETYDMNTCYDLPSPFFENSATFAPDGEAFSCYPRLVKCGGICTSPTGCTFGAVSFDYVNKYNLTVIGWNKYIQSFDCQRNTTASSSSSGGDVE